MIRYAPVLVLAWSLHAADFARDIQPVLARCTACHGPGQQMAALRVDDPEALRRVVVPGKSAESTLVKRISSDKPGLRMPPSGPPLTPEQIALVRAWIDGGAQLPAPAARNATAPKSSHWSFQPVARPGLPEVRTRAWPRNAIDQFVLARLEREKIAPSPEASKPTLVRRLYLDLIGLPPTPEQMRAFLADNRPDAYERLVDQLLASPHYGEKWARHWLDLARYADSDGYEKDLVRPFAWRYRNWVIDALNRDLPFDQFTVEQLAGDLLPDATLDQRIATGFHRNVLANREAGVDRAEARFEQMVNRTNTIGTVWLGLTVGCAQCHNHKYDPIPQRDYYRLMAFVNNVVEADIEAPLPGEIGPYLESRPKYVKARAELLAEYNVAPVLASWEKKILEAMAKPGTDLEWDFAVTEFRARLDNAARLVGRRRDTRDQEKLENYYIFSAQDPDRGKDAARQACWPELRKRLAELNASHAAMTEAMTVVEDDQPVPTHIALGGDHRGKGDAVQPGGLTVLPPLAGSDAPTRLDLARWLVSRDNPLTARVAVNRIWNEFFGRALVRTTDDFGTQGEKPTHPELLDWLAAEFMDSGWSFKHLQKLMVTSAVYRQSSHTRKELSARDPENTLLARQSRLRLPAELIRDSALWTSGLLNTGIGGPSVRPPQPAGVAELGYSNSVKWVDTKGPERYRRGLYIHFQRTTPYPMLMAFDAPDSNVACTRRARSNTPLQALNLLNDPVFYESAQALALRTLKQPAANAAERVEYMFECALGRKPNPRERERLLRYLDQQSAILAKDEKSAQEMLAVAPAEAAWTGLARVVLNLDEFITRE